MALVVLDFVYEGRKRCMNNRKVSQYGLLIALAFLLSYIECLIPLPMLVPGMKVGLANIVIIFAMYVMNTKAAVILS